MKAWQEALWAADAVRKAHGLPTGAATTAWLDGIVGGRLGVKVMLPGGREVTGTTAEIGARVDAELAQEAPAGGTLPGASPAGPGKPGKEDTEDDH